MDDLVPSRLRCAVLCWPTACCVVVGGPPVACMVGAGRGMGTGKGTAMGKNTGTGTGTGTSSGRGTRVVVGGGGGGEGARRDGNEVRPNWV